MLVQLRFGNEWETMAYYVYEVVKQDNQSEQMLDEWRENVTLPTEKIKWDNQSYTNYCGIKFMSQATKLQ